jgi:KTSC domain
MHEQKIQDIKDALREMISLLTQRGEPLSDELKVKLSQVMEHSANRITALRAEQKAEQEQQPGEDKTITPTTQPVPGDESLLWILSGGDPNVFVNYLRTYPGGNFQALLGNPSALNNLIVRLQKTMPQGVPGQTNGIPDTAIKSSNVRGMKYNPSTRELQVAFQGGSQYKYDQVPPNIFKLLEHGNAFAKTKGKNAYGEWWPMKNPSLGAAVNKYLKQGGYEYQRLQ